jgi:hypothetical protein
VRIVPAAGDDDARGTESPPSADGHRRLRRDDPWRAADYEYLQFMAECVVVLHYRVVDGIAVRFLRIAKYRGSAISATASFVLSALFDR